MQQITIDNIRKSLNDIQLADRSAKDDYYGSFHAHLYSMLQFSLLSDNMMSKSDAFNANRYYGLERFILEHSEVIETKKSGEIDAEILDDARVIFKKHIKSLLGNEGNSEYLKPVINFTADTYENYLMYEMMHAQSKHNPWTYTNSILNNGYIYLVSDSKDLVAEFKPKIVGETKETSNNIGFITKANKEKEFKGLILDDRLSTQEMVYGYLKSHAKGFGSAKSKDKIIEALKNKNRIINKQHLVNWILLPLKRAGLIGSGSSGYYFIDSEDDFKNSYQFHKAKIDAMQRTIDILNKRAEEKGFTLNV